MSETDEAVDFIIVGGGIAGCVLASRLKQADRSLSVLVIEAGLDVSNHPLVPDGSKYCLLLGMDIDWNYKTVPQMHLNGRVLSNHAGRDLGGSSAINADRSGWLRGERENYDLWAKLVNDPRWSYNCLLPYFRRIEDHHDPQGDPAVHGFGGPVKTECSTSMGRNYPLRKAVEEAWAAVGVCYNADVNSGDPIGLAQVVENRINGQRQLSCSVYPLDGVQVMTETLVNRVIIEEQSGQKAATAVELADSYKRITVRREVIISAGAYRTPQLLLLCGVGPVDELQRHAIDVIVDLPDVGRNFQDHPAVLQWWRLRHPERGLALGSPALKDAALLRCRPVDFTVLQPVPKEGLSKALARDGHHFGMDHDSLLSLQRGHIESYVVYVATNAGHPKLEVDGTHISSAVVCMLPTSRGTVTLADKNPKTTPVIDPNYMVTEADRYMMREGLRKMHEVLRNTPAGHEMIEDETVEDGEKPLSKHTSDEDLDNPIRRHLRTSFHPAGSASMGKVVDSELRVKKINRLRVVNASVIPVPLAAHIQYCVDALAGQAADIILQGSHNA